MKGLVAVTAVILVVCLLIPCHAQAQSKEQGIRLFREANSLQNKARNRADMEKTIEKFEQALAMFRIIGDLRNEAMILNNLGLVYMAWGQHEKAVEYYQKALAVSSKVNDVDTQGMSLCNLGVVYEAWGQYEVAAGYYQKSLAICRELKDRKGESESLGNLGNVYCDWGQYGKAVEHHEQDLAICRELKYRKGEAESLHNLGNVFRKQGKYNKAAECFEKSLSIKSEISDRQGEGPTLNNLGVLYSDWGQYEKAVEHYEKSMGLSRELKDRKVEEACLINLGNVYFRCGKYDKAVDSFEKSIALCRDLKDRNGEGIALCNLGVVLKYRGDYRGALENFQKALAIYTEIRVPTNQPKYLIASSYMDTGDLAKAEPLLKEAGYYAPWGQYYLLKSDYPKAKEYYGKVLKSADESRHVESIFTAYTGLATACEGLMDDIGAAEYYEKAVKHTEELRSGLNPSERETFFDVRVNGFSRTAPYEGLARVQIQQRKLQEALKTTEYTRARVFAEAMSRMSEGKALAIPPEVVKQDNSVNNELASLKKNLQNAFEKNNKLVIESLEPQVEQLESKLQEHVQMLREKYPLFAATKYPQPTDLSQTALNDNEWVLAYHVTDPGVIVYLTHGKTLVKGIFKPITRKEVDELVRKFRRPMEVGSGETVSPKLTQFDFASGKRLSDILLADILPDLPPNTPVIIVPDGSLGVVPFEMLVLNDGGKVITENKKTQTSGAEFFGDRNPISYYQSITALTLARTLGKHQKSGEKTLAMVDPVFSADDPRLTKVAKQERDKLLASLPTDLTMSIQTESGLTFPRLPLTAQLGESLMKSDPQQTELYEGLTVKKTALMDKDLTPYRSLVFATHGYFGKDLPGIQEPVLVMSLLDQPKGQDGFLRLSEVMGLKLNCDIAALTACQTGLGRHISGEGTMGMGRAFQYAGAKSVLMSLWSVSESASVNLVESFFTHLKEGKNKLEALKLAREEIRKAGYDHPFYWAPFILVGEVE